MSQLLGQYGFASHAEPAGDTRVWRRGADRLERRDGLVLIRGNGELGRAFDVRGLARLLAVFYGEWEPVSGRLRLDREVARVEAAILAYVGREQTRIMDETAHMVAEQLAPLDGVEARLFLAELRRRELP